MLLSSVRVTTQPRQSAGRVTRSLFCGSSDRNNNDSNITPINSSSHSSTTSSSSSSEDERSPHNNSRGSSSIDSTTTGETRRSGKRRSKHSRRHPKYTGVDADERLQAARTPAVFFNEPSSAKVPPEGGPSADSEATAKAAAKLFTRFSSHGEEQPPTATVNGVPGTELEFARQILRDAADAAEVLSSRKQPCNNNNQFSSGELHLADSQPRNPMRTRTRSRSGVFPSTASLRPDALDVGFSVSDGVGGDRGTPSSEPVIQSFRKTSYSSGEATGPGVSNRHWRTSSGDVSDDGTVYVSPHVDRYYYDTTPFRTGRMFQRLVPRDNHVPAVKRRNRCWNPAWLGRLQSKVPWHEEMAAGEGGPWLSLRAWEAPYRFFTEEIKMRWATRGARWLLGARVAIVLAFTLVLFFVNVVFRSDMYEIWDVEEIYDALHNATVSINAYFVASDSAFNALMIVGSLSIDIVFLVIWAQWAIIGESMRLPLAHGILYATRAVVRLLCLFPFPKGYVWRTPYIGSLPIPSLTVPYQPSDDFFFSGHIGFTVLAIAEHFHYRCWWGVALSATVSIFQTWIMIVTRGHFTIDMITGAIVAHWAHMLASKLAHPVDFWLSLPPRPVASSSLVAPPQGNHVVVAAKPKQPSELGVAARVLGRSPTEGRQERPEFLVRLSDGNNRG